MPELRIPSLGETELVDLLEPWMDGVTTFDAMKALPLDAAIRGALTRDQLDALDRHAPESLLLPSGQRRKLEYVPSKAPILAVKLQELFGCAETPTVAGGRVPVLLHLLSPGHRSRHRSRRISSPFGTPPTLRCARISAGAIQASVARRPVERDADRAREAPRDVISSVRPAC
jgi:HrpA-like RNA helicase